MAYWIKDVFLVHTTFPVQIDRSVCLSLLFRKPGWWRVIQSSHHKCLGWTVAEEESQENAVLTLQYFYEGVACIVSARISHRTSNHHVEHQRGVWLQGEERKISVSTYCSCSCFTYEETSALEGKVTCSVTHSKWNVTVSALDDPTLKQVPLTSDYWLPRLVTFFWSLLWLNCVHQKACWKANPRNLRMWHFWGGSLQM